jgi:hypothetical protein
MTGELKARDLILPSHCPGQLILAFSCSNLGGTIIGTFIVEAEYQTIVDGI